MQYTELCVSIFDKSCVYSFNDKKLAKMATAGCHQKIIILTNKIFISKLVSEEKWIQPTHRSIQIIQVTEPFNSCDLLGKQLNKTQLLKNC